MNEKQLNPLEALKILENATAALNLNRLQHIQIIQAIEIIKKELEKTE